MIFYGEAGGGTVRLPEALSVEIDSEYGVPADDMTVTFSGEAPLSLRRIYAVEDGYHSFEQAKQSGAVIFAGIVDEVQASCGTEKRVTVYARSLAALALDNECESGQYIDPTLDVIYSKHLLPFGITRDKTAGIIFRRTGGTMTLLRSQSHWSAVSSFCKTFLSSVPRVDFTGRFRENTFLSDEELRFDNKGGTEFSEASVRVKRYGRISKVYVQTSGGQAAVVNESALNDGIVRERRIDLADSPTGTLSDADRIIAGGEDGVLTVTLVCHTFLGDAVGRKASVSLGEVMGKQLYIYKTKYVENGSGRKTTVTLSTRRER